MNQTVAMMANPRREQLESLISINRELAAGLSAAPDSRQPRRIAPV